jgi:hypothetical protein
MSERGAQAQFLEEVSGYRSSKVDRYMSQHRVNSRLPSDIVARFELNLGGAEDTNHGLALSIRTHDYESVSV